MKILLENGNKQKGWRPHLYESGDINENYTRVQFKERNLTFF